MSRRGAILVMTAYVFILVFAAAAKTKSQTMMLQHRQHRQVQTLHHYRCVLRFFAHHPSQAHSRVGRREIRRARVWVHVVRRELAETKAALHPKPALGHLSGWLCIHSREGAWNANTGNGYYGGLQMTKGWAGRVEYANQLSPAQQIAAAEAEAATHGWSYSWMRGQWPNTFPPCAGYF